MSTDLRIEADNRPGQLAAIGAALGQAGMNIEGFCGVTAEGMGFLHVLVQDGERARDALEQAGFSVTTERGAVLVSDVEDRPGFLGEVSAKLADASINIEAAYLATDTRLVFIVDNAEAANEVLG